MYFINKTKNSINISDIGLIIPFFEDYKEQYISSESINNSKEFKTLCARSSEFIEITKVDKDSRIENNLLFLQKNNINLEDRINVLFKGSFGGYTGYSKSNRNLLYSLSRYGIDISIDSDRLDLSGLNAAEKAKIERFITIPSPDSILLHSAIPSFAIKSDAKYSILYTTIESVTIPDQFIDGCNMYDEVWVTSDFCKEVLLKHGFKKEVYVIPNSINTDLYKENGKTSIFNPKPKKFTFLTVSSWDYRKGVDALLKAYLSEFNKDDDVSLLIISGYKNNTQNDNIDKDIKRFIEVYNPKNNPNILRYGYPVTDSELANIYRSASAFVAPSRGEGFGLCYCEASLCGLPIIATNHSGHTMFLNKNNSILVDIDSLEKSKDMNIHYWDNHLFPGLKEDSFIKDLGNKMRYVYNNYDYCKKINNTLKDDIINSYSLDSIGKLARKRLEVIWNKI